MHVASSPPGRHSSPPPSTGDPRELQRAIERRCFSLVGLARRRSSTSQSLASCRSRVAGSRKSDESAERMLPRPSRPSLPRAARSPTASLLRTSRYSGFSTVRATRGGENRHVLLEYRRRRTGRCGLFRRLPDFPQLIVEMPAIDLAELQPECHDDKQDRAQRQREPAAAVLQLADAVLAGFLRAADDGHPVGNDRIELRRCERVHLRPRERQFRRRFAERELLVADFDARILDARNQCARLFDAGLQLLDVGTHAVRTGRALVVLVSRGVARRADAVSRGSEHLVRRLLDRVVAVALDAALVEEIVVDALLELLREDRVAGAADLRDRADAGRRGAVIAVAIVARRRREIVA